MRDRFICTLLQRYFIGTLILAAFLFLAGCGGSQEEDTLEEFEISEEDGAEDKEAPEENPDDTGQTEGAAVYVYVCGAVNAPGVYELSGDARVFEALESAGGMTGDASLESVNLARAVVDGEQIYVPTVEEAARGKGREYHPLPRGTRRIQTCRGTDGNRGEQGRRIQQNKR